MKTIYPHLFLTLLVFIVLGSIPSKAQSTVTADSAAKPRLSPNDTINTSSPGNLVFEKVEIEASVDINLWRKHLEVNLRSYIEEAARRKMKVGIYTINVRFLVEKDGRIADVKALNDPGFGLAQGAVRVVRTGPRWKPGELNGKKVRSYHTQPITFQIQEG